VLCAYTALLVLETEADYARFGIDRKALADILVVNDGRVAAMKRAPETVTVAQAPPRPKPKEKQEESKPMKKMARADEESAPGNEPEHLDRDGDSIQDSADKVSEDDAPPPSAEAERREAPRAEPRGQVSASPPPPSPSPSVVARPAPNNALSEMNLGELPYEGTFKQVMESIKAKKVDEAVAKARGWREEQPGDVLALVALGEALEAAGDQTEAARAYGSIIDLFPGRADLRRFAGVRLERLKAPDALKLAADAFEKAAEQRADHPASHRLLAFMLLRLGEFERAFTAIEKGAARKYPGGRFAGVDQILREDAGLIAAAWIKADPPRRQAIIDRLQKLGATLEDKPSLRFILNWETDANDVDFHIVDGKNGHAFFSAMHLPSGGDLYADVTTGYGPECFTIRNAPQARAYPYHLMAHYYSRGPMGYGMGKLEIIDHDGKGGFKFIERPYVVMVDRAFVDLGVVDAATLK
jgi:tetratricopeptide (TPR) repeat protein